MKHLQQKHTTPLPSVRTIRRACSKELYRTAKRLKTWIAPEKIDSALKIYIKKVIENLAWIVEHQHNKKAQANWWEDNVCADIAALWEVEPKILSHAFRDAYGG